MFEQMPIDAVHFLFFVIPGFMAVWFYRYMTSSKKEGDFELLGLSFFWGMVIMATYPHLVRDKEALAGLVANIYATSVTSSLIGMIGVLFIVLFKKKNRLKSTWNLMKKTLKDT